MFWVKKKKNLLQPVVAHQRCQTFGWGVGLLVFKERKKNHLHILIPLWPQNNFTTEYQKDGLILKYLLQTLYLSVEMSLGAIWKDCDHCMVAC